MTILREANPIEISELATVRNIADEPAFCLWVPYTLQKRDRIIYASTSHARKNSHKYSIEVPHDLDHTKQLDPINGNCLRQEAIDLEMANVRVDFGILEPNKHAPIGCKASSGHLVYDGKMDFTCKARWVKDGHKTSYPDQCTHAGVVYRYTFRIALTYAALNGIDVMEAEINNEYL